jgi:hypothetical protein
VAGRYLAETSENENALVVKEDVQPELAAEGAEERKGF